ncbi:sporulation initiation phosphotransferase F [Paraliobacillus ryukyuensis]|uniref:Two-component system response regulator (Stage 0 sporulation protein F) n=1 Tax=Paraliobacillus ryukyuensis TaxID=200904 RepID=A0A366EDY1_9BACI|nr:response regulator [Paraliobacillus ryukyuensis]RBP00523.1 two-component system response regulator (stage 0 sporulation protein F) [Paraliobacillus ryukyuensis]
MVKSVLVVDDQLGIRLLLEEIIKSEGHVVHSFENGLQALHFMKKQTPPDLLVIDFWMDIMNGAELIEQIEAEEMFIPTIIMSGAAEEVEEHTHQFESVKKILAKPFNIAQVKQDINELLTSD